MQIWRAGISLGEAFAQIEAQTHVHFGFWPLDGTGKRIPLTLFLSPVDPPELRSVMVQLAWVTDCSFAVAKDDSGSPTYQVLLPGALPSDVPEADAAAQVKELATEVGQRRAQGLARVADKLREYRDALSLSPEELAARYRTGDDTDELLLLDLLDPRRRAAVELVCGLSAEDMGILLRGELLRRKWAQWTEAQQALLAEIRPGIGKQPGAGAGIKAYSGSGITVSTGTGAPILLAALRAANPLSPDERVDIARYLGEVRTPAEQAALRARLLDQEKELDQRDTAAWATRRADELSTLASLSPSCEALLASYRLPIEPGKGYRRWQLLESVAAATHLNVVSDSYSPRLLGIENFVGAGNGPYHEAYLPSVLEALRVAHFRARPRSLSVRDQLQLIDCSEWGSAGSFLWFRSLGRSLARGAILTPEVLASLDAWLEAHVGAEGLPPGEPDGTLVPIDPSAVRGVVQVLADLSETQLRAGGTFPYEDPADSASARVYDLRSGLLNQMGDLLHPPVLRLLASLSDEQWATAQSGGLRWQDMTPAQQALLESGEWRGPLGRAVEDSPAREPTLLLIRQGLPAETVIAAGDPAGRVVLEVRFDHGPAYVRGVSPELWRCRPSLPQHLPPAQLCDGGL